MTKKATKAQVEQRVRIVYEMLLMDTPYIDIVRYAATNWAVKSRMTDNYIKKANALIIEEAARMREDALEKHLAQRALIRHKALKDSDPRLAFDILRDETKLLGLYPSAKVDQRTTHIDIDLSDLTDDQLKRLAAGEDIAAILANE